MESVLSWLNQPLFPGSFLHIWMGIAGFVLLMLVIALPLIRRRKKKAPRGTPRKAPTTERPQQMPTLELANLQGIGSRQEQQDSFGISRFDRYEEDGLLVILCDGMGGMAEGRKIAADTASELMDAFPWENDKDIPAWIRQRSGKVYQQFRGHGGTTLVAALLRENALSFWCVGDSDLFLLRGGSLYSLNLRQEFKNELVLRAIEGAFPVEEAFVDVQAGALSEYIGKENVRCDYTRIPFLLQAEDVLLLCSDGVSDTLTLRQIRDMLALPPQACCEQLEKAILDVGRPNQDNFTAIVLKYHGKGEEQVDGSK
ncbi:MULTISPECIES: PP2C family serine/threonine-protein phosphatase [unclassified Clostridium]|uniref:PP2C family protein-serine/threonine phosphatase n=1 Tax=unclassified Clostridium TaxID=2614128 RepID=UPI0011060585|nr:MULTISPECIES: PP2C family serine/threonine-protein phosphatase [unclassified Clostridium]